MGILSRLFGAGPGGARDDARAKGVSVEDVERDLPIFTRGDRFDRLERGTCVRYSLVRRPGSVPRRWSLLQRDAKPGAPFPHGWTLHPVDSDLPEHLRTELARVAAEWTEEFLEFEADEQRVSAYWEEWGGAKRASIVVGYLQRLAQA